MPWVGLHYVFLVFPDHTHLFFIRVNHHIETKLTYQNKFNRYRHKHFTSEFPIVIDESCDTVHHCQTYAGGDESCVVNLTS